MKLRNILFCLLLCAVSDLSLYAQNAGNDIAKENKAIVNQGGSIKLYPLPATTYTNIYIEWTEMQPFTVSIYDKYGILLQVWNEKATRSYQKALSVTQLPSGDYYLIAKGTKGILKENFKVER